MMKYINFQVLGIILTILMIMIVSLYTLLNFSDSFHVSPTPPIHNEVIHEKYCYVYVNDTILNIMKATKNLSEVSKLKKYYESRIIHNVKGLKRNWKEGFSIPIGRKVQIIKYLNDSTIVKAWVHEGRHGAAYVYIPTLCLHDSLPEGMKEPERYYPENYQGLRHKNYNK